MDRGDEIISNLLEIFRKESIPSAIFSGIGYTFGGRQFIERFKVGLFVPMHFVAAASNPHGE